jgi:DNA-binding helix-hairpin-helix protein with protein kinase domain
MPQYFDAAQRSVDLQPELARGGEGIIYPAPGDQVAKVYLQPPTREKAAKLQWMAAVPSPDLRKIAAWPTTTLHDRGGKLVGFLMPRASGQEIHNLYNPGSRKKYFPNENWRFLLRAALNSAIAFETMHDATVIVGDVNQKNILVSEKGLVRLIDCDSYQIRNGPQVWRCEVGVPEFTPPELQGSSFRDVVRTQNHDLFGLAVTVFHFLFLGRHPFSGRYLGGGDQPPIEDSIKSYRFAFGSDARNRQMQPPLFSVPLDVLPPGVAKLFARAFLPGSERDSARPLAREWRYALSELEQSLVQCAVDTAHAYPKSAGACPWCDIMGNGGPAFFFSVRGGVIEFTYRPDGLDAILAEIEGMHSRAWTKSGASLPAPAGAPPPPVAQKARPSLKGAQGVLTALSLLGPAGALVWTAFPALLGALLSAVFLLVLRDRRGAWFTEIEAREKALVDAVHNQHEAYAAISRVEAEFRRGADELVSATRQAVGQYKNLSAEHREERTRLERRIEEIQRAEFLKGELLGDYQIPGIGPGLKRTLGLYSIESAYDVLENTERIATIRNFGKTRCDTLGRWAHDLSRGFRFDAKKGVPEPERRALVGRFQQKRLQLEGRVRRMKDEVGQRLGQVDGRIRELQSAACTMDARRVSAEADLAMIRTNAPAWYCGTGYPAAAALGLSLAALIAALPAAGTVQTDTPESIVARTAPPASVTPALVEEQRALTGGIPEIESNAPELIKTTDIKVNADGATDAPPDPIRLDVLRLRTKALKLAAGALVYRFSYHGHIVQYVSNYLPEKKRATLHVDRNCDGHFVAKSAQLKNKDLDLNLPECAFSF